jgi:hypothetical protein
MAAPVYATTAEYEASPYGVATDPGNLGDRLAIASREIDGLLLTAVYDINGSEQPTRAADVEAIREATIAQASFDIDPNAGAATAGGIPAGYTAVSAGPISLTKADTGTGPVVYNGIAYPRTAVMLLRQSGLLPGWIGMA